jgi:hypothetical protein
VSAPQYAIMAQNMPGETDEHGRPVIYLGLEVSTEMTQHLFYLCHASDNYQDVAKKLHDMICKAGAEARRAQSGLLVVNGDSDAFRKKV